MTHVTCRLTQPRTGISSGTLRSVIEYGLPLLFLLRQTDRHADEATADATGRAVTWDRGSKPQRWPVTTLSASAVDPRLHVGQLVAILVEKPSARCRSDSELLYASGEKACAKLFSQRCNQITRNGKYFRFGFSHNNSQTVYINK